MFARVDREMAFSQYGQYGYYEHFMHDFYDTRLSNFLGAFLHCYNSAQNTKTKILDRHLNCILGCVRFNYAFSICCILFAGCI